MNFKTPLRIREIKRPDVGFWRWLVWGNKRWEIIEPFSYTTRLNPDFFVGILGEPKYSTTIIEIKVPRGRITDLATIPRFFWFFMPPGHKRWAKAAVIHDECLLLAMFNKDWADEVFNEALKVLDCPDKYRKIMVDAVEEFGEGNY